MVVVVVVREGEKEIQGLEMVIKENKQAAMRDAGGAQGEGQKRGGADQVRGLIQCTET